MPTNFIILLYMLSIWFSQLRLESMKMPKYLVQSSLTFCRMTLSIFTFIFTQCSLAIAHLLTNFKVCSLKYRVPFWRSDPRNHGTMGRTKKVPTVALKDRTCLPTVTVGGHLTYCRSTQMRAQVASRGSSMLNDTE